MALTPYKTRSLSRGGSCELLGDAKSSESCANQHVLLKYVNGNPGGMRFPSGVDPWGKRDHLKTKRHKKLLEIYADIAYATSAGHRSIQGLVVMFAGVPIGWQTSQQPFVTHSTAEAELVSYCEGLLAGRATEALLCAMWGEEITNNSFERVMYGDNAAAIGLALGQRLPHGEPDT